MPGLADFLKQIGLGAALVYAAAAYGVFFWLDKSASDDAKSALAGLLKLKDYNAKQISSALLEIFDLVYSRPLFRWKAFVRSALLTLIVAIIYLYETGAYRIFLLLKSIRYIFKGLTPDAIAFDVLTGAMGSLSMIVFLDYVSLFAIRRWLMFSGQRPILSLIGGLFIGALIAFSGSWVRIVIVAASFHSPIANLRFDDLFHPLGLLVPSVMVFLWLLLFGIGILFLRLVAPISWVVSKVQWLLKDGKDHPLDAIGYVAAAVVFSVALVWRLAG